MKGKGGRKVAILFNGLDRFGRCGGAAVPSISVAFEYVGNRRDLDLAGQDLSSER